MDFTDQPAGVRQGEEPDADGIEAFLKEALPDCTGPLNIRQFPSGFSNLTYLLIFGDREIVLRRPPFGTKAKTAHDMSREYRVLKALAPVFPYCPQTLVYSADTTIIGCPFYLMARLRGIILRRDLPSGFHFSPEQAQQLCQRLLDLHVELHSIDWQTIGLENFGQPAGYVARQVEGWSKRYRAARTPDAPDFEEIMGWVKEKMPTETQRASIIHNDFKLDNLVLDIDDPTRIVGVLDWEMATIGDPLMDLGNSLAYWVQEDDPPELQAIRTMPTHLPGMLNREELVQRYAAKSGFSVSNMDFYYCFGLFRLAAIAQQIYYRYYQGQTKDKRFKTLIFAVQVLEKTARQVIENSKL